ncbi:MAG TPA: VOC family protein [Dongiaceae bacterium]|nr:VOC family protein [Dongiaceae bacterium]
MNRAIRERKGTVDESLKNIPGIQFVDHVAIAVRQGELEGQLKAFAMLGFREIHREEVHGTDQVREVLLEVGNGPNLIQLLEPLSPESPVQKLIDRNGGRGGLAHVAFRVKSAKQAFDAMQASGFNLIDKDPRPGSRGTTVFFVHPKSRADSPFGFLIEIVEDPKPK